MIDGKLFNSDVSTLTLAEWNKRNEAKVVEHEKRVSRYASSYGIVCNANRVRKLQKAKSPVKRFR